MVKIGGFGGICSTSAVAPPNPRGPGGVGWVSVVGWGGAGHGGDGWSSDLVKIGLASDGSNSAVAPPGPRGPGGEGIGGISLTRELILPFTDGPSRSVCRWRSKVRLTCPHQPAGLHTLWDIVAWRCALGWLRYFTYMPLECRDSLMRAGLGV